MTAGLTIRPRAATKVSLAPAALAGLLGAALIAGSVFGAAITTQFDAAHARVATAATAARPATDGLTAHVRGGLTAAATAARPATDGLTADVRGGLTAAAPAAVTRAATDGLTADVK